MFGVLIADGERLYDPCAYHDRLLLGLSGIMSEAELHQIKVRLHQGERQKAARGELHMPLPVGLAYGRDGRVNLNPDEEVQARLLLLFAKFRELRSAKAVMRYLQRAGLRVPVRPLRGPAPQEVVWQPADGARVLHVLKNPAYAGAYVYGRRCQNPIASPPQFAPWQDDGRAPAGLAGLSEGHLSWLHQLGGVHGEPAAARGQSQPIRSGIVPACRARAMRCCRASPPAVDAGGA